MRSVRTFLQKHVFICSVIITLTAFCPMFVVNYFNLQYSPVAYNFIVRFWPACILIYVMKWFHLTDRSTFSIRSITKGCLDGWIAIIFSLIMLIGGLLDEQLREKINLAQSSVIINYVFEMLCVGLLEEVLARGIIFGLMQKAWKDQKNGLLKAALCSGVLFGMMHLINLFGGAGIYATASQIIYGTFIGVYFSAVYIKCKCIWPPVILHALIDICGGFYDYFSQPSAQSENMVLADISIVQAVSNIIITIPFIVWALWTINKNSKLFYTKGSAIDQGIA